MHVFVSEDNIQGKAFDPYSAFLLYKSSKSSQVFMKKGNRFEILNTLEWNKYSQNGFRQEALKTVSDQNNSNIQYKFCT
jgi:hypothetical protein